MRCLLKTFILPACVCIGIWITVHWFRPPFVPLGEDIQKEIVRLETCKPDILLIGNSYLAAAVNPDELSRLTGRRCLIMKYGGSATACWYLLVKNVLRPARHVPKIVLLYFRGYDLTLPAFHADGRFRRTLLEPLSTDDESLLKELAYRKNKGWVMSVLECCWPMVAQHERIKINIDQGLQLRALSLFQKADVRSVRQIFNRVFVDFKMNKELLGQKQMTEEMAKAGSRAMFDFTEQEPHSFLPHIIRLVREKGSRLILVRHRCRDHAMGISDDGIMKEYMLHLRPYLAKRNVIFFDFSQEKRIELKHFIRGDHFDGSKSGFDSLLSSRVLPYLPSCAQANETFPVVSSRKEDE
jgi:hypothetical protein